MSITKLSNTALIAALKRAVANERTATADVIAHLAEVDARKLYLTYPCSHMTTYCIEALGYSESAAGKRVTAARLAQRFPQVVALLRSGDLHLTAVCMVSPILTHENFDSVVNAARGRTKTEIAEIVVRWAPRPDVPSRMTAIPVPAPELPLLQAMPTSECATRLPSHDGRGAPTLDPTHDQPQRELTASGRMPVPSQVESTGFDSAAMPMQREIGAPGSDGARTSQRAAVGTRSAAQAAFAGALQNRNHRRSPNA